MLTLGFKLFPETGDAPQDKFYGRFTETFAWPTALTLDQMKAITGADCTYALEVTSIQPALFNWNAVANKSQNNILYNVEMSNRDYPIFCGNNDIHRQRPYMLRASLQTYDKSVDLCKSYGGKIAVPKSKQELKEIMEAVTSTANYTYHNDCDGMFWIGIVYKNGTWIGQYGEKDPYIVWGPSQPNGRDIQACSLIVFDNGNC